MRVALRRRVRNDSTATGDRPGYDASSGGSSQQLKGRQQSLRAAVSSELCELTNDTRTRYFAALDLKAGTQAYAVLCSLIDVIDSVLARYSLPPYYAERRLHFSVAWSVQPFPASLPKLPASAASSTLPFDTIECRIGERVHRFPF